MGSLGSPWALLALPLALLPLLLHWRGRTRGRPVAFSSVYLLERARRPARRALERTRAIVLLRCLVILFLVLAAARPFAPGGGGDPADHLPTRAVVVVDVSASATQRIDGRPAWEAIRAAADSVLAAAGADDDVALAAVADGLAGWWEASPAVLRATLGRLEPAGRPSDWPAAIAALAARLEEGTEAYLLTDGSRGLREPAAADLPDGRRIVRAWVAEAPPNRALVDARWADGAVAPIARSWGPDTAAAATAGRRVGEDLRDPAAVPLDGSPPDAVWAVADTATLALAPADPFPADDRLHVAAGAGGPYRIARYAPPDRPPEPGDLFWAAALEAAGRGARVERVATLEALARSAPDLALLPLRAWRPAEAALLADLAARGTRLLFAPTCPDPACAPPPGWLPAPALAVPDVAWALGPPDRRTTLAARPAGAPPAGIPAPVPAHLLDRAPLRGVLALRGGPPPEWSWPTAAGGAALWARGRVALWLVPLGPPVTRLGTTPVFPLVADAALAAWDPVWARAGAGVRVGEPLPVPPDGAVVTGPLHASGPGTWRVPPGGAGPRAERPGFYRVAPPEGVRAGSGQANFVAVNGAPGEGDLAPVPPAAWRAAWGEPVAAGEWREALFPRRRGVDLTPWLLVLALAGLALEAALRRARSNH